MKCYLNPRKAQISIFVIVALVIVVGIALFFLFRHGVKPETYVNAEENPVGYLKFQIEPELQTIINKIPENGGHMENKLTYEFDGKNISYLCYTKNNYEKCINQEPMLISHLKQEIQDNIFPFVQEAFIELKNDLEKEGYSVKLGNFDINDLEIDLQNKKVVLEIERDLTIEKQGAVRNYENYRISLVSRLYDLGIIVQEIVSQEAEYCHFDHLGFMLLHADYKIEKFIREETTLYKISHKESGEVFWFAIKTCTLPGGV